MLLLNCCILFSKQYSIYSARVFSFISVKALITPPHVALGFNSHVTIRTIFLYLTSVVRCIVEISSSDIPGSDLPNVCQSLIGSIHWINRRIFLGRSLIVGPGLSSISPDRRRRRRRKSIKPTLVSVSTPDSVITCSCSLQLAHSWANVSEKTMKHNL